MNSVPTKHFGIGIDTARYGHHVSFMDENKCTARRPFHFNESAEGYQAFAKAIKDLRQKSPGCVLHIHVDAAGQYAENLLQWIHSQDWQAIVSVGQPARNKAYRKVHYDKRKADPIESLACARFAIVERPPAMQQTPPEFSVLRDAVAQMEASAKARTAMINQLHNMLARAFPELAVIVKDISSMAILKLLQKYPTAQRVASARIASIKGIPYLKEKRATAIHEAAKISTASNQNPTTELLIKRKVESILSELKIHGELEKIVENAVKELPDGSHRRIRSIPGIGPQTEAALIAKMVTIDRFRSANALIGYFGIFPEEMDVSGTDKKGNPKSGKSMRMSRKGNDLVRRLLYTAAQCAAKHNPPIKALLARQLANGKDYNTAIGHCMAKLLRQVFALWSQDCDFDKEFETPPASEHKNSEEKENVAGHSQARKPSRKVVTATTCSVVSKRPPLNFSDLRERISMRAVLELLNWSSQSGGVTQRGRCPVHGSTSPKSTSFAVNPDKGMYICHRCGSQGNALDLWAATQNLALFDAAWDLIERLGIAAPLLKKKENCPA